MKNEQENSAPSDSSEEAGRTNRKSQRLTSG